MHNSARKLQNFMLGESFDKRHGTRNEIPTELFHKIEG